MSTNLPDKKVVRVRGMEIKILSPDEVIVTQNNSDLHIHIDEVLLSDDLVLLEPPQYTVEIITFMQTKPRSFVGDKAQAEAIEEACLDILKMRKHLRKLSKGPNIQKLPFTVEPYDGEPSFQLSAKHLHQGEVVLTFPAFRNVYQSTDALYLDPLVSKTLFAVTLKTVYRAIKRTSEYIKNISPVVSDVNIRMFRRITPNLIDAYISPELHDMVRSENPLFQKGLEQGNLLLKMTPYYVFRFIGGDYDTREYVSEVWKDAALNSNSRY